MRRVTMRDVAAQAGVSQATVSYVLNGAADVRVPVSDETRRRVLRVAADLNYTFNHAARSLRAKATRMLALAVPGLARPSFAQLAVDFHHAAAAGGYTAMVLNYQSPEEEQRLLEQLLQRVADGVVFFASSLTADDLARLPAAGVPVVHMSNAPLQPCEVESMDVVSHSWDRGAFIVTQYLLNAGHKRIAFLGGEPDDPILTQVRLRGFEEAVATVGGTGPETTVVLGAYHRHQARAAMRELLSRSAPPTAVVAMSDSVALGALYGALESGTRVPDQVAIAGIGNVPEGAWTFPGLTTVGTSESYESIVQLLIDRLQGGTPDVGRYVERSLQLFRRGSA